MTRLRGRAPKGKRLRAKAPRNWKTTTILSSIRMDGQTTCMTIEAATNTEVFRVYVREVLVPTLRPGDVVVMDNLSAHKNPQTIALIEGAGAAVHFLPPYSPEFNPIEMMWSKVKAYLRKVEARCTQSLFEAIGCALKLVTAQDAMHWFIYCGYNFI